jgi:hypothetical protein
MRLRDCSLVCRTWRTAAVVASDDLELVPPTGSVKAAAFQSWMVQHGSSLKALTFNRTHTSRPREAQLPFQQLRSLTKLWATNADLLNLPCAVDPAGATGSTSSTTSSSSSSSDSGNSLSALTSLAELGLSRSSVSDAPGALQYLPALGASLTRLQLAYVCSRHVSKARKPWASCSCVQARYPASTCCCCIRQQQMKTEVDGGCKCRGQGVCAVLPWMRLKSFVGDEHLGAPQ